MYCLLSSICLVRKIPGHNAQRAFTRVWEDGILYFIDMAIIISSEILSPMIAIISNILNLISII